MLQGQTDIIEPLEQAMLAERVHLKRNITPLDTPDRRLQLLGDGHRTLTRVRRYPPAHSSSRSMVAAYSVTISSTTLLVDFTWFIAPTTWPTK